MAGIYDRALKPVGVLASQLQILGTLYWFGTMNLTELAERLFMDRTTFSRNIRPLERRGLVALRHGSDRRSREVTLTPPGEELFVASSPYWQLAQEVMGALLGDRGFSKLAGGLVKLRAAAAARYRFGRNASSSQTSAREHYE